MYSNGKYFMDLILFSLSPLWNHWGKLHLNRKLQGYQCLALCQSVCFISICYSLVVTVRARSNSYSPGQGEIPVPHGPGRAVLEWAVHFLSHFRDLGTLGMKLGDLKHCLFFLSAAQSCSPRKVRAWYKLLTDLHAWNAPERRSSWPPIKIGVATYFCCIIPD